MNWSPSTITFLKAEHMPRRVHALPQGETPHDRPPAHLRASQSPTLRARCLKQPLSTR